jgi:hypothetical protein
MTCRHCGAEKDADGFCRCVKDPPLPPHRTASAPLDLETVDEDGAEDDAFWLANMAKTSFTVVGN